jgi:amino acid adenylation domain-containing protein
MSGTAAGTHNIEDIYPLSSLQEGFLFHSLYSPGEGLYVDHMVFDLRDADGLDTDALRRAFQSVVDRHQALRTAFVWKLNSRPQQVVLRKVPVSLIEHDWSNLPDEQREARLAAFLDESRASGFDPAKPPLFRMVLFRSSPIFARLAFTYHHIIMDAWSVPVVFGEMQSVYHGLRRNIAPQLGRPRPFSEYIKWLRQRDLSLAEKFWRRQLEGATAPTILRSERIAGADVDATRQYADIRAELPIDVSDALRSLAQQHTLILNTLIQGAWAFFLGRCSNTDDVFFGSVVSGRPYELEGVERMVGLFTNSLPVRARLVPQMQWREWLQNLQRAHFELHEYEWSPLEKIQEWSEFDRNTPLFESVVIVQNIPATRAPDHGQGHTLEIIVAHHDPKNNFPLTLMVLPGKALSVRLFYDTRRFGSEAMRRALDRFTALLSKLPTVLNQPLWTVSVINDAERSEILNGWKATHFPVVGCVHECFEAHASVNPHAIAAACAGKQLTYGALNARANSVARALRARCAPESTVVVMAYRDLNFLAAMLGVFKAGCVYLPLDPGYPAARISQILGLSGSSLVLAGKDSMATLTKVSATAGSLRKLEILDLAELAEQPGSAENLPSVCSLQNLAYVIYTSGSTGVPKGAMVQHGGMLNHLHAKIDYLRLSSKDVVAQIASQCFDISVWQFLSPLLAGGRVEIFPDEITHNPSLLLTEIANKGITVMQLVPSMLRAVLEEARENAKPGAVPLAGLSYMVVIGEELLPDLVHLWFEQCPGVPLVNSYGPTECSDEISHHFLYQAPSDSERIPIGHALANIRLYVMDSWLEPAPIGTIGELFAGGAGVGRGYLHDPARTAVSFVPDPFSSSGERLYRTGDLVCRLADGTFAFFGRIDSQLKIRGYRIELGEIESVLSAHPAVKQAVVLVRKTQDAGSSLRLSAYIVVDPEYRPGDEKSDQYHSERTEQWKAVFDDTYGQKNFSQQDDSLHRGVWINTYTGQPFAEEELLRSVENSVARIKTLHPERVLDIGCGTGLLLFRIARDCRQYWGTDFSAEALESIEKRRHLAGGCDLRLLERPAHDLSGLEQEQFDLIILNEIVQYFPDGEYLLQVLSGAIKLVKPGGSIFVGGLRNLHLLNAFHASVELFRAEGDLPIEELKTRIRVRSEKEKELLVAPEFFGALRTLFPAVQGIRLLPKNGTHKNEFTKFRYDAILRIGPATPEKIPYETVNWNETGGSRQSLKEWLSHSTAEQIRISGIPNARTAPDVQACRLLSSSAQASTVQQLRLLLQEIVEKNAGVDPEEIVAAVKELGRCAELSWATTDSEGSFNLLVSTSADRLSELASSLPIQSDARDAMKRYTNLLRQTASTSDVIAAVRQHVQRKLPDYMTPADYLVLPSLPLTPNGKIDRQSLARMDIVTTPQESSSPVSLSPTEELVITIWSGILGTRIAPGAHFLESGGHSLLATQVISRAKKIFQVDLPLRTLFDAPTTTEFARAIDGAVRANNGIVAPPILPSPRESLRPLSFAQQRLWIMEQMDPGTAAYNLPSAIRIDGSLQIEALRAALGETLRRHESLRTRFKVVGEQPYQAVDAPARIELQVTDLSGLADDARESEITRLAYEEGRKPFDLLKGPLFRVYIIRRDKTRHLVFFTMHHIVSDAWSAGVLISELAALYRSYFDGLPSALPPLAVQYADFASWQRQWMQGEVLNRHLTYWKQRLSDAPKLGLPADFPRTRSSGSEGLSHIFVLSPGVSRQLSEFARKESVTLFMTTLAAFKTLLYRTTGQRDIVVGTDIANRNYAETERLIGFFVNLLVLRSKLSGGLSFRNLVHQIREISMEAFAHQDLPFDVLTRELRLDRAFRGDPLFDVLFVFQNAPTQKIAIPQAEMRPLLLDYKTARFDIALFMEETSQGLAGKWIYRTSLFQPSTIMRLSSQFEALLESVAEQPNALLDEISISAPGYVPQEKSSTKAMGALKAVRPRAVSLLPL